MLKISLIICAFNEEKLLGRCLTSVLASRYIFHEVIVVDNNSTDNTAKIAHEFLLVKVVNESKQGLSHARQKGYLESDPASDIIAYIDADTELIAGWGQRILDEFEQHPEIVSVSGPVKYNDIARYKQWAVKYIWWNGISRIAYGITGYMIMGSQFAIRRSVLYKMGGIPTVTEFMGEDTAIAKEVSNYGKVKFLFDLEIFASGRRLEQQGLISTVYTYAMNYLFPGMTKEHEDYR